MGDTKLGSILVLVLFVAAVVWLVAGCKCGSTVNNFRAGSGSPPDLGSVGGSQESRFLPVVMSSLGAPSEQVSSAARMINSYDEICGKVSAASEIQKVLNAHGPSGDWTSLVNQLNQDLYSVKQNRNACQGTTCTSDEGCAYGTLNPTLSHGLPPGTMPGWDCVSSRCQLFNQ